MSMVCKWSEKQYTRDGSDVRRVVILADATPATKPTTGENVERLPDTTVLDGGSILMCLDTSKTYVLGNDGETWSEWAPQ